MAKNQSKFDPSRQIAAPSYAPDAYTDWFPVRITGTTEGPPSGYTFVEVWLLPDGSIADKTGGRVNDDNTPAVSLAGDLAEDDIALCRVASGVGGQAFELSPIGGGGGGGGGSGTAPLLVEVTGNIGGGHTVKRLTYNTSSGLIEDYSPPQVFNSVRATVGLNLPVGTRGYLIPIPDVAGNYWVSPHASYAHSNVSASTPGLLSEVEQTIGGVKHFTKPITIGPPEGPTSLSYPLRAQGGYDVTPAWLYCQFPLYGSKLAFLHTPGAFLFGSTDETGSDTNVSFVIATYTKVVGTYSSFSNGGFAVYGEIQDGPDTYFLYEDGLHTTLAGGTFKGGILVGTSSFAGGSATPDTTTSGGSPTVLSTVVIPPETLGTEPGTASTIETEATVEIDPSSTVELEITFGGDPVLQTGNQSTGMQPSVGVAKVRAYVTGPDSVRATAEWMPAGISGGTRVASVDVTGLDFSQPIDLVVTATASAGAATLRAIDVHPRWRPAEPDVDGGAFDGTGGRGWLVMGDNWQNSISDI